MHQLHSELEPQYVEPGSRCHGASILLAKVKAGPAHSWGGGPNTYLCSAVVLLSSHGHPAGSQWLSLVQVLTLISRGNSGVSENDFLPKGRNTPSHLKP